MRVFVGVLAATASVFAPVSAAAAGRLLLGTSVQGRPIVAYELGNPAATRKVLVVGCIHGNEAAGTEIARRLRGHGPQPGVDLWVVPSLNPDGQAAGTRGNAHGVDLNRNFPLAWQHLGGIYDSGSKPLSEPESRIAYRLIVQLRPAVSIWFHQHLDLVDESGGDVTIERRYAALAGMRVARLRREPGSIVIWENAHFRHGTAFVVELPAGSLNDATAERLSRAVETLARGR